MKKYAIVLENKKGPCDSKKVPSDSKTKRPKLGEITNTPLPLKKKKKENIKSVSSAMRQNYDSISVSKVESRNTSSAKLCKHKFGSIENTKDLTEQAHIDTRQTVSQFTVHDSITRGKLEMVEEQNRYLFSLNEELKSQLAKGHEEILQLNKGQREHREQMNLLYSQLDSEQDKGRTKECEYRNKMTQMTEEFELFKKARQDQTMEGKVETEGHLKKMQKLGKQIEALNGEKHLLKEEMAKLESLNKQERSQSTKKMQEVEVEIQQGKNKLLDLQDEWVKYNQKIGEMLQELFPAIQWTAEATDRKRVMPMFDDIKQELRLISESQSLLQLRLQEKELEHCSDKEKTEDLRSENRRLSQLVGLLQKQPSRNHAILATEKPSAALEKKLQETMGSLEYWKKKYDEAKLESIKSRKMAESFEEQEKDLSLAMKKLEKECNEKTNYVSNQRLYTEDLKSQIVKLESQKSRMVLEGSAIMEKLESFKSKVIYLETKLRQSQEIREPSQQLRSGTKSTTPAFQNYSIISHTNSHMSSSICGGFNMSAQSDRSTSKGIREYKGETQSKLQEQFSRCTKFPQSPSKPQQI